MNTATNRKMNCPDERAEQEWNAWFATPGDADDFIFYWEEQIPQSEK